MRLRICRLLIEKSQESFLENIKPLEIPEELTGEEAQEFEIRYKQRMKGIMMFVGQLLVQGVVAKKVFYSIVDQLLRDRREKVQESNGDDQALYCLEALCVLLQTAGHFAEEGVRGKVWRWETRRKLATQFSACSLVSAETNITKTK